MDAGRWEAPSATPEPAHAQCPRGREARPARTRPAYSDDQAVRYRPRTRRRAADTHEDVGKRRPQAPSTRRPQRAHAQLPGVLHEVEGEADRQHNPQTDTEPAASTNGVETVATDSQHAPSGTPLHATSAGAGCESSPQENAPSITPARTESSPSSASCPQTSSAPRFGRRHAKAPTAPRARRDARFKAGAERTGPANRPAPAEGTAPRGDRQNAGQHAYSVPARVARPVLAERTGPGKRRPQDTRPPAPANANRHTEADPRPTRKTRGAGTKPVDRASNSPCGAEKRASQCQERQSGPRPEPKRPETRS